MSPLPRRTWGTGAPPVVFLHGFTGDGTSFDHLARRMGGEVSATCLELPGHGAAPLPAAAGEDAFLEVVDAVAAQLPRGATLVGYSQGARVALAVAARHPGHVGRLVLESVNPGLRQRRARSQRRAADEALAQSILTQGVAAFVARWEQQPLFEGLRRLPAPVQEALRARRHSHTAAGLAGALRCLGQGVQPDLWPALPGLRVPTLLLSGALDVRYSRLAWRAAAELPVACAVRLAGAGHAPHLERPDAWADEVLSFFAATAVPADPRHEELNA